jgi:hypothetical protein
MEEVLVGIEVEMECVSEGGQCETERVRGLQLALDDGRARRRAIAPAVCIGAPG